MQKAALQRERETGRGDMEGSLYFSAPFGSFIPQRLGFIGGSFNNKGSAFEMKSGRVCGGRASFFYFKMVILRLGVRTGIEMDRIHQREAGKRGEDLPRERRRTQGREVG